jgi:PhoPQ-activated pathogenicity-related protein
MIRQRKNSLFFATPYSASVASVLSSVIATARQAGVNVLAYLVALQQHHREVMQRPAQWLPWNYHANLTAC